MIDVRSVDYILDNTNATAVQVVLIDPLDSVIDVLQTALITGLGIDFIPGCAKFRPKNLDIRREPDKVVKYIDGSSATLEVGGRVVTVSGPITP